MAGPNNPPLIIRVGANLEELKKALAEGRVLIDNTSTSLGRMTASLRGDKLLQDAQKLVQGVEAVGGAATLTAKQQAKVNAQLQEAIEKYRLLGKDAPASMLAVEKATHGATQKTSLLGEAFGKLGPMLAATFSIGAMMQFGRVLLEDADNLVRLSDKTGISIESLQTLQFAAKQSGLELETVTTSVTMMQKRLAGDDKSAVSALGRLGIAFSDFKYLSPDEQFKAIAIEVAKVEDPMMRAKIATDLFGKGGGEVLPLLVANFEALTAAAPKMSDAAVRALDDVGDAADAAMARFKATIGNMIGGHLAQIYEGLDNIKALIREDGSIDWRVAAGGAVGPLPKLRQSAPLWKPTLWSGEGGIETDLARDRDIADIDRRLEALKKQEKAADLLKVTTHGLNDEWVTWAEYTVEWEAQGKELQNALAGLTKEGLLPVSQTFNDLITELPEYSGGIDQAAKMTDDARQATRSWRGELSSLASSFRLLQQSAGEGGLGRFAQKMASVTGSMDLGGQGSLTFAENLLGVGKSATTTTGRLTAMASGALQMAAAMEQATQSTSHWQNAVSGAATGASMGAVAGPYGAAAGAIVGLLYGYYKKTPGDDVTAKQLRALQDQYGGYVKLQKQMQLAGISAAEYSRIMSMGVDDLEAYTEAVANLETAFAAYNETLTALKKGAEATKTIADSLGIASTQTQFERLGVYVSAIFGKMLRETGSLIDAFEAVGATLDKMIEAQDQFGFTNTALLDELLPLRRIMNDNADLTGRISGLGQLGAAFGPNLMRSMGILPTFGADLADTFSQLSNRSGVSQQQALMLMQAPLQQLWEAVVGGGVRNGLGSLDAETKRVLQLAIDAGLVGADMRSIGERQLDMLTNIRDLIAGVPEGAGSGGGGGGAGNGGGRGWNFDYNPYDYRFGGAGGGSDKDWSESYWDAIYGRNRFDTGTDGFEYFGSGTPALLHGWERVQTKAQAQAERASTSASGPVTVQFYEIHAVDADGFDQLMAKKGVPAFTKAVRTNAYKNNPELAATLRRLVDAG